MSADMDPVVKKETLYVAGVTAVLGAAAQLVWALVGRWDASVLLGGLLGWAYGTANFLLLGRAVQKAVGDGDELMAKRRLAASRSMRTLLLALVFIAAFALPAFNWIMTLICGVVLPQAALMLAPLLRKDLKKGGKE